MLIHYSSSAYDHTLLAKDDAIDELEREIEKLEAEVSRLNDAFGNYAIAELCRKWMHWDGDDEELAARAADDGDEWLDVIATAIQKAN